MGTLLAEPFLLASYHVTLQRPPRSKKSKKCARIHHVSATCSSKGGREGYATTTVQGDGIHVLELSNTHSLASHTLGPSAFFSAPTVTRFESSGAITSYAVMQSASDGVDSNKCGRTVRKLQYKQPGRPEELPDSRLSAVFPQLITHIWAPLALPSHIIAVSPSGKIMLASDNMNLIASSTTPNADNTLLKSWVFQTKECAFLSQLGDHGEMTVLTFILIVNRLKVRITLVELTGQLDELTECDLGLCENVIDITCDPTGYISVLIQTGEWRVFRIGRHPSSTVTVVPMENLQLVGLVGIDSSKKNGSDSINGPTLLSVGSSHVLLAGIENGLSPEISLLLWDLQYSVVLASQTISLPSTSMYTPSSPPRLELVPAAKTQALLVISPAVQAGLHGKEEVAQCRSTIFVLPFDVPPVSTIALAMGKSRDTEKWLKNIHSTPDGPEQDETRRQVIESVQSLTEKGQPQAAEAIFFDWIDKETARLKREQVTEILSDDDEWGDEEPLKVAENEQQPKDEEHSHPSGKTSKTKRKWKTPTKPVLSHHFVSSLLNATLMPSNLSKSPYPSKIVLYLINRKAVGNAMIGGGVLAALRSRRDWESIYSAMKNMSDIPETDLITILAEVVAFHRLRRDSGTKSTQVGMPADIPRLEQFLSALVGYTTSPPALCQALRRHLADVRDIICILEVLEKWAARLCNNSLTLVSNTDVHTTDGSRPSQKRRVRPALNHGMPPFENVVSFLQSMLDTHFLSLLQSSVSYEIIVRLNQSFKQSLEILDEMDCLRGPLESFIRAKKKDKSRKEEGLEGHKERKHVAQAADLAVGLYQIERLDL